MKGNYMRNILILAGILMLCGVAYAQPMRSAGTSIERGNDYANGNGSGLRAIFNSSGALILNADFQPIAYQ
jgi:hypothetical protein